jgi:hypothetical protein
MIIYTKLITIPLSSLISINVILFDFDFYCRKHTGMILNALVSVLIDLAKTVLI